MKPESGGVPTIQVDLASPQSPDSVNLMDEFTAASKQQQKKKKQQQQEEDDQGLMMKPSGASEADGGRDQPKRTRCLSDPGPSADEEEDEPFLP